ncbi:MAG: response regulator [Planctomycetes bacterium]|nr:response regulator [Planctomycetota bacterium]
MPITFQCAHCKKTMTVKDELRGTKGRCPQCGTILMVPAPPAAAPDGQAAGPSRAASSAAGQTPPARTEVTLGGGKVLIIDDDADFVRLMAMRLKSRDCQIVAAGDALSAISTTRKEKPDVILLDIGLPAGGGFAVLQRLMNSPQLAGTPVIVVTATDPSQTREKALNAGAQAFLQKPVNMDELLAAMQKALGKS